APDRHSRTSGHGTGPLYRSAAVGHHKDGSAARPKRYHPSSAAEDRYNPQHPVASRVASDHRGDPQRKPDILDDAVQSPILAKGLRQVVQGRGPEGRTATESQRAWAP